MIEEAGGDCERRDDKTNDRKKNLDCFVHDFMIFHTLDANQIRNGEGEGGVNYLDFCAIFSKSSVMYVCNDMI